MNNLFVTAAPQGTAWDMLLGGLLAFLSPCVLPMLPVYALMLLGSATERASKKEVTLRVLGLLCGFVLFFTVLGAGAGALGSFLRGVDARVTGAVTGALMIFFGLIMLEVFPWALPQVGTRGAKLQGFFGSVGFGLLLVLSWTPCISPLLGNALVMAASQTQATAITGAAYLALFAVGLCAPLLLFMVLGQWLQGALGFLRKHQRLIRRIAGAAMIVLGVWRIIQPFL